MKVPVSGVRGDTVWYGMASKGRVAVCVCEEGALSRVCKPKDSDSEGEDKGEEDGKLGWVDGRTDGWHSCGGIP